MKKFAREWSDSHTQSGIRYQCGYCGTDTTPSAGWNSNFIGGYGGYVLICTNCNKPSFIEVQSGKAIYTIPAPTIGQDVVGLPEDIHALYDEARKCTSIAAHTAAVLTCRKILMHVAVEKGAKVGKGFIDYVDYLAQNGYIPPDGKAWVDHIRTKSNEANHEILVMSLSDAEDLVSFTEMLLRLVYEFKHRLIKNNSGVSTS